MPKSLTFSTVQQISRFAAGAILFGTAWAASGCAHRYNLPVNSLDTPETRGIQGSDGLLPQRTWGRMFAGVHAGTALEPESGASVPSSGEELERTRTDLAPFFGGALALDEKLDLFLNVHLGAPLMAGVKYQLLGEPESRAAKGNWAIAIRGGLGAGFRTADAAAGRYGSRFFTFETVLSGGYRLGAGALVYLAPRLAAGVASGSVNEVGDPPTETGGTLAEVSGLIFHYGVGAGAQFDWADLFLRLELAWAKAPPGELSVKGFFPALAAGFRF